MYRQAGNTVKAGEAYEEARQYDSAAQCFREAGNVSKWCESLEKGGKPFEAARIALEHGDPGRAIRSLQVMAPSDEEYVEAANLLVEVLKREGHLDLASRFQDDDLFLLRVKGDSMTGAGIHDGDLVLAKRQETVENGEIAVALIGEEATVKRVRLLKGGIRLEPANKKHKPMIFKKGQGVTVAGKVLMTLREV